MKESTTSEYLDNDDEDDDEDDGQHDDVSVASEPLDDRADAAKSIQQAELFGRRLDKLARHLRRYPTKQGITCYRIYERDIAEIPLIVDRYEDHLHLTEYSTPYLRTPEQHSRWLDLMAKTTSQALDVAPEKIFFKRRNRQVGNTQHEHIADQKYEVEVKEGELKFIVNLSDYIDTGLFLDHRLTRSMVRGVANGKRVLNLFAYTGSFSVYAADGGAAETTTVDWSNTYLDWARRNMTLNGFTSSAHRFVRDNAVDFVYNHKRQPSYEIAIVDPPTFSNSKRTETLWDVQRDSVPLLEQLQLLMSPGGVIYYSNNFRGFKLEAASLAVSNIHEISNQTVPPNYRNRRIHRCWRIVV